MGNGYPNSTIAQILEDIISQLSFEGESHSNIADILLSILNQTSYDKEPYSVLAELFLKLKAKIEGVPFDPYDKETHSVIADILVSILNETEYTDVPQSRIAELLLELKEELESYTEITVSGSIVSFTTNVSKPLVKLKADVVATQSGSGTPYPAGGGKNKFVNTNPILGCYLNTSGSEISYAGWNISDFIPIKGGETYHFNPNSTLGSAARGFFYTSNVYSAAIADSMFNSGEVTITAPNNATYVRFSYRDTSYDIQLELGSSATSYSPVSNIRPITGWSGAVVSRVGSRNILDPHVTKFGNYTISPDGSHNEATDRLATHYLRCKPNTSYKAISDKKITSYTYAFLDIAFYDENLNYISRSYTNNTNNSFTFTTPANAKFLVYSEQFNGLSNVTPAVFETYDRCLVEGDIDSYEPFVGNTYTIAFGDTYYGCELVVIDGEVVLRAKKAIVDLETLTWSTTSTRATSTSLQGIIKAPTSAGVLCGAIGEQCYEVKANISLNTLGQFAVNSSGTLIFYRDNSMPSGNLVYPLATPIEIQLTPIEIDALAGDNVIFADTGDVEVTYLYKGRPET